MHVLRNRRFDTKRVVQLALVASLALALSLTLTPDVAADFPGQPFVGVCEGLDIDQNGWGDGSYQVMAVTLRPWSGRYRAVYYDHGASMCGVENGKPLYACVAIFTGTAEGYVLTLQGRVWCLDGTWSAPQDTPPTDCTYHPADDTLVSWCVFHRLGAS